MDIDSPQFRAHLHSVVAETSPEAKPEFNRLSEDGWRYRQEDDPRPLYEVPDWGAQEDGNWRWHHQSLALTGVYIRLHQERGDARAIPFLETLIDDWAENSDADPVYGWRDHTAALRLKRLVRLFGVAFELFSPAFRDRLLRLVDVHAQRLRGDLARSHHNHALDQIFALALAKRYFPFLDIPETELEERLAVERNHLLSAEGVVTENSPGYQSWIPARIVECERLLSGRIDEALLQQDREFTAWVARPDGTWPELGDTLPGKRIEPVPAARRGLRVFPHAGYAAYRSARTWLVAKCGFLANAHRHADDGTFLLAIDGEDVFIEAGMFGYARGWERDYARSADAHNLSVRTGSNVIRSTTSRRWRRHAPRWGMTPTADGVSCRSFMFDDATYVRDFSFSGDRVRITDRFDAPGDVVTRFHVPPGLDVEPGDGCVRIGPALLRHGLPDVRVVAGHRTTAYLRYGPARVVELPWPAERTASEFTIEPA
ncbi:hypothetical protein GCM10028862_18230 [Luteimonas pelagia]